MKTNWLVPRLSVRVVNLPDRATSCSTAQQIIGVRGRLPTEDSSPLKSFRVPQF
jgi:hypothetical protein